MNRQTRAAYKAACLALLCGCLTPLCGDSMASNVKMYCRKSRAVERLEMLVLTLKTNMQRIILLTHYRQTEYEAICRAADDSRH